MTNRSLCKDIVKLSGGHQTFRIEAFHNLVNHFAPKMHAFTFTGMWCRFVALDLSLIQANMYNTSDSRPGEELKKKVEPFVA